MINYKGYAEAIKRGLDNAIESKSIADEFKKISKSTKDYDLGVTSANKSMKLLKTSKQLAAKAIKNAKNLSQYSGGRKALKNIGLGPRSFHSTKLYGFTAPSAAGLGVVAGAAYAGYKSIKKAEKAAIKEIDSLHSPERNKAHREQILTIRKQGVRKRAAKNLRATKSL